jgi:GTP-binding protein
MFVDYVEIEVTAGPGGAGCISFHSEKYEPKGGPDGGDGGYGGDIVAVADPQLTTLMDYRYQKKYQAEEGRPGGGNQRSGRSGEDTILRFPVGTIIVDQALGQTIADLDEPGARVVLAKGGKGGHGNAFYRTSVNQAPRKAQDGQPGEHRQLALELKLLADVGLVGLPNAGKSTILSSFSAARPKIADYPFTTLKPNLGIVKLREFKSFVMADLPGLIEGAAQGKGLGHQFLKHIQRTRLLVYVVDVNEPDIEKTIALLDSELGSFDPTLLTRPRLYVLTKTDTLSDEALKKLSAKLPDRYLWLSAVSRKGADEFLQAIERTLDQQRTQAAAH